MEYFAVKTVTQYLTYNKDELQKSGERYLSDLRHK